MNIGVVETFTRLAQLLFHNDVPAFVALFRDLCTLFHHSFLLLELGKVRGAMNSAASR